MRAAPSWWPTQRSRAAAASSRADIAIVDASVEARWQKAAALLGSRDEWRDDDLGRDDRPTLRPPVDTGGAA